MKFFSFHIGDYCSNTHHLSMMEDAAYMRLLRRQYETECALPADIQELYRLSCARTRAEKRAVDVVIGEYFILTDSGYVNCRAAHEIEQYQNMQKTKRAHRVELAAPVVAAPAPRTAAAERQARARQKRAALLAQLAAAGKTMPAKTSVADLQAAVAALGLTVPEQTGDAVNNVTPAAAVRDSACNSIENVTQPVTPTSRTASRQNRDASRPPLLDINTNNHKPSTNNLTHNSASHRHAVTSQSNAAASPAEATAAKATAAEAPAEAQNENEAAPQSEAVALAATHNEAAAALGACCFMLRHLGFGVNMHNPEFAALFAKCPDMGAWQNAAEIARSKNKYSINYVMAIIKSQLNEAEIIKTNTPAHHEKSTLSKKRDYHAEALERKKARLGTQYGNLDKSAYSESGWV